MSLIKNNSHIHSKQTKPPVGVQAKATPKKVVKPGNDTPAVQPSESFTPTTQTQPTTEAKAVETKPAVEEKPKLKTPREGSSMALMLEDMKRAEEVSEGLEASKNGTLVQLDVGYGSYKETKVENAVLANAYKTAQAEIDKEKAVHGKSHGHGHGHGHSNDALLGGHLGTEVVEKVGHSAHHSVGHGTEAAGHAVAEAKSHGASHAAGHAVTEAKGHAASHVAGEVKSEVAHGLAEATGQAKAEGTTMAAETAQDLAQVTQSGHAKLSEAAGDVAEHGADAAHHLSTGLTTALATSAAASGGLGAVMLYKGGKELAHGVKEKDGEKIAEGVGGLAVGARSVAAASVMTSMVSSSSTVAQVASVASQTLTPLGVLHGAIDVGIGVKDLTKGKTTEGLLKVGFGTSVIAGAVVGGIPLTLVALGFLGAKVGHAVAKGRQAKKAAKEAEAQQQQPAQEKLPDPAVYSDPYAALKDSKT